MSSSTRRMSLGTYALAFAAVLSPAWLQVTGCPSGNPNLSALEFEVDGVDQLNWVFGDESYAVTMSSPTAVLRVQTVDPGAKIYYQWWEGPTYVGRELLGTGDVEAQIDIPGGERLLRVETEAPGGKRGYTSIEITNLAPTLYACTEGGLLEAAAAGGVALMDCPVPTTVSTTAEIAIDKDLILMGGGNLIVEAGGSHRVFYVYAVPPPRVELREMTISGGAADYAGGGILNHGALTLRDLVVTGCTAEYFGGGIFHQGPSLNLERVTLTGNTAREGGGIHVENEGTLTINDSTVSHNEASLGGGLYNLGTAAVSGSTFTGNAGGIGGAIFADYQSHTTLDHCIISSNTASSSGGGIETYGTLSMNYSIIWDNDGFGHGGGIQHERGTTTIANTTISGNRAVYGGGIQVKEGSLTATNTTISNNVAVIQAGGSVSSGGGVYGGGGAVTLIHSTVAWNQSEFQDYARALYIHDATITLTNSLIEGDCGHTTDLVVSDGYNIESPGDTCGLMHPTDQVKVTPGALDLGLLGDHGGPTATLVPGSESAAIDKVPPALCPPADQRGNLRPQGAACDVGAIEFDAGFGPTWPTGTPEEQGFDSDELASLVEWIDQSDRPIDSLLIVRNGVLVVDAYFYPYFGDPPHDAASVTKSVTSTVTGIAIEQGLLAGLDQRVMPLFPEAPAVGGKENIELQHLLTMSSGLACGENDIFPMIASGDWVQYILDRPMANMPGTSFVYCSPCAHWLSAAISRASGQSADEIAQARLFGPIGITSAFWPSDPQGYSRGGGDLQLHPHDMGRVGQLFLNGGTWKGQRVISSAWIEEATGPSPLTSAYGYLWWRFPGGFEAVGRGGQSIRVHPDGQMVVVLTGRGSSGSSEVMSSIMTALQSDGPLPANPTGSDRLTAAMANAMLPPPAQPVPPLPAIAADLSGELYRLDPNQYGVQCYSVEFNSPSDVTLYVVLPDGDFTLPVGMDGVPRFSADKPGGFQVGIVGSWTTPTKFVADYDQLGGSTYLRVENEFGSDIDTMQVQLVDKTGYFPPQVVSGVRVVSCD